MEYSARFTIDTPKRMIEYFVGHDNWYSRILSTLIFTRLAMEYGFVPGVFFPPNVQRGICVPEESCK